MRYYNIQDHYSDRSDATPELATCEPHESAQLCVYFQSNLLTPQFCDWRWRSGDWQELVGGTRIVALWVGRVSAGSCLLKPLPLHRWSCCRGDDHALTPYALPRRPLHHSWLWPTGGQMTERRGARGWGWYHKALADQANPAVAVDDAPRR